MNFLLILEQINEGVMPEKIEFYFGDDDENVFLTCASLGLSKGNENFVNFLSSDLGYRILSKNITTIYTETRNIYFDKANTNKSLYDFFISQQDERKKLINAFFSYGGDIRSYITDFLMRIDSETDNKFAMLTSKNVKYIFLLSKNYQLF